MMIREPVKQRSVEKELKVRIPVDHHLRLHSMKVLTGKAISSAVCEALDEYFASQRREGAEP